MSDRFRRVLALLRDPRTPGLPKLAVALAAAYLLWPVDLVPDFIVPVFGFLDDLVLVWASLRWLLRRGGAAVDAPRTGGPAGRS
jgi:uncharacterized membrane protein YkvA (DUF1232 family)